MIYIGNHVSVSKGYAAMGRHALSLGGDTFAFFPRNPRGGRSKTPSDGDVAALRRLLAENGFGKLVVHGAYTMNVCAAKEEVRANSFEMLRDDLLRLQALPGNYYNLHPGCHTGQGAQAGTAQIAAALAEAVRAAEEASGMPLQNTILLETMAGKGSEVGGTFEELQAVITQAAQLGGDALAMRLGVCLDTCHVWDGGYDIRHDLAQGPPRKARPGLYRRRGSLRGRAASAAPRPSLHPRNAQRRRRLPGGDTDGERVDDVTNSAKKLVFFCAVCYNANINSMCKGRML